MHSQVNTCTWSINYPDKNKKPPLAIHTAAALCLRALNLLLALSAGYNEECQRSQEAIYHIWGIDKETIVMCHGMKEDAEI